MKRFSIRILGALVLSAVSLATSAQTYPDKPIRLVVPYAAGGGADNAARVIAGSLGEELGQQVIVDNRSGASGSIGAALVANARADGYTVLYDASTFAVNPVLRKLPYDALKDFVPVTQAVSAPNVMVIATNSPYLTLQSFLDDARKQPGQLTFASYGAGSPAHLIGELLKREAKLDIIHVPYKGGAPALIDVMGGQVNTYFANAASSLGYIKEGKLRALAVTSAKRMADLPNVPTIAESGFSGFEVLEWNGFLAPKGTPSAIVDKLQHSIRKVLVRNDVRQQLTKFGLTTIGSSPAEFSAFIESEIARWTELAKSNDIKAE